jgi:hypothetical protein
MRWLNGRRQLHFQANMSRLLLVDGPKKPTW